MNSKSFAFLALLATLTTTLPVWADYTFKDGVLNVDGEVDLGGEPLVLEEITSITGSGKFTNSGAVADLTLGLAEAVTLSTVTIEGNIRLVKTGPATLTLPKDSTYAGGTWVKDGKLSASSGSVRQLSNFKPFGAYETIITVEADGTLDLKGYYNWPNHYAVVLNGGTLTNGAQTDSISTVFDPDLTLTADSAFELTGGKIYSFAANADLDGNTLTMSLGGKLHWLPSAVGNGTIAVTGSSTFQVDKTATYSGLTLNMGAPMDLRTYTLGVKDYIATYTGTGNKGTGELQVSGAFTPVSDSFYPPTMMDGSTIDLSTKESTWSLSNAAGTAQFAADATVTIDVGTREIAAGDKIVAWPDGTEYAGRTFVLKMNGKVSEEFELQVSATGLTVAALGAKVPTATWTGAVSADATNPDNWSWANVPEPTDDMLPSDTTAVVIPWNKLATLNWPETDRLSFATVEFSDEKPTEIVVLEDDRDWRGLGAMDIPFALDLNGHKLFILLPGAESAVETTVKSSAEGGELHASVAAGKTYNNTKVTLTDNLTLVKEGEGAFVATKYPQEYAGETIVNEGTLRAADGANMNAEDKASPFGATATVTVGAEGVLDPRGSYAWENHTVKLNGGAITNTVEEIGVGNTRYDVKSDNYPKPFDPTINLLADSVFATTQNFNFKGKVVSDDATLKVWIASGKNLLWVPTSVDKLTTEVVAGGYLKTLKNHTYDQKNSTLVFTGGTINLIGDISVSNYVANSAVSTMAYDDRADPKLTVYGTFKPVTQNFVGCMLKDGTTLDLSEQTATWTSTGYSAHGDVTFAEGATVTIEVGDREFKGTTQIVEWSDGSKASAAGATFVLSAAAKAKGYSLSSDENGNGLYVSRKGMMLLLR